MTYHFVSIALLLVPTASLSAVPVDDKTEFGMMISPDQHLVRHLVPTGIRLPTFRSLDDCLSDFHVLESFWPEKHWCLTANKEDFTLRFWKAPLGSDGPPNPLAVLELPVDQQFSAALQKLWLLATAKSQYSPYNKSKTDGVLYRFGGRRFITREILTAETHSPEGDVPPTWLATIGERIFDYAMMGNLGDANLAKEIDVTYKKTLKFYGP